MPGSRRLQAGDPESLAGYELTGRLGQGGQGVVYLGTAPDGGQAAIKVLNADLATDPGFRRRFKREAAAAQRVASFCTAQVLDASFDVEQPYIVSEYVDGHSLKEEVEQHGPHSGTELQRLAVATATALVAVHEAGIVHRDFKPANVLLAAQGPRVIDFGVAAASDVTGAQTQSVFGTPGYMAPEQISGEPATPAADVFSWGAVMTFAATGRTPFTGSNIPAVINKVMADEPDLTGIEAPWRAVIAQCLAKDPAARPTSADLLMTLLGRRGSAESADPAAQVPHSAASGRTPVAADGYGAQEGSDGTVSGRDPQDSGGERKGSGGKRLAVIGAALVLFLAIGAGGYAVWASLGSGGPPAADSVAPAGSPAAAGSPMPASPGPGRSPTQRPSPSANSAQAEIETSSSPSPSASPGTPSTGPSGQQSGDGPAFTRPLAGHWVSRGTFPNGKARDFAMTVEAGGRTAALTTGDNLCTWNFQVFGTSNRGSGGVKVSIAGGAGCGKHQKADIFRNDGRLVVRFWGNPGKWPVQIFALDRA
ncbi:hypothetical protein GCM10027570_21300 [Streptomonospora sediminis]